MKKKQDYDTARSDAIRAIKRAFNENNIVIPFPIRTIDLPKKVVDLSSYPKLTK